MNDEQQIRDLITTWLRVSAEGDISQILPLMTEDVVFLVAGHPPMRGREAFAASFAGWQGKFSLETDCEIQEIQVSGNLAYSWTRLSVTMGDAWKPFVHEPGHSGIGHRQRILPVARSRADRAPRWRV